MDLQLSGPDVGAPTPEEIAAAEPVTPTDGVKLPQGMNIDLSRPMSFDSAAVPAGADYGSIHGFGAAFAINGNDLTSGTYRATKYWLMRLSDEAKSRTNGTDTTDNGLWINKEEFDREYSLNGAIKFDPHFNGMMSKQYASTLKQDKIDDAMNEAALRMSNAPVANTAGSLVRGLLDPIGLAAGYVAPELAIAKWGKGASVASRSGTGMASIMSRTANGAINGAASSLYVIPYQAYLDKQNQTKLMSSGMDMVNAVGMMTILGSVGGFMHAGYERLAGKDFDRQIANAAMREAMTSKDPSKISDLAKENPAFVAAVDERTRIREILSNPNRDDGSGKDPSTNASTIGVKPKGTVGPDTYHFMADSGVPSEIPSGYVSNRFTPKESWRRDAARQKLPKDSGIDSTSHAPAPSRDTPSHVRILEDILSNPEDKRIREAVSDDERFLAEAWKRLWGVDIKYVSKALGQDHGFSGFVKASDPTKAYLVEGNPLQKMTFVAGHELGHSVRLRDPVLWQEMVNSMMKSAKDTNGGEIGRAWSTLVKANAESGVHLGLSYYQKMDETFATVLGHALQDGTFWNRLRADSPSSWTKLSTLVYSKVQELRAFMGFNKDVKQSYTPSLQQLHDDLSLALSRSGLDEKTVVQHDAAVLSKMYKHHVPEFRRVTKMLSDPLTSYAKKVEVKYAATARWVDRMFPQYDEYSYSFTDNSEKISTVVSNVRINSNNPGLWVLEAMFKKYSPDSEEGLIHKEWLNDQFSWQDGVMLPRRDPSVTNAALATHPAPIMAFKKKSNGLWDIAIFQNDDFGKSSRWRELFDSLPQEKDLVTQQFIQESIKPVTKEFDKVIKAAKNGEDLSKEFRSYLNQVLNDELYPHHEDAKDMLLGFRDRLAYRIAQQDQKKSTKNLLAEIDNLLKDYADSKEPSPSLDKAWKEFRHNYKNIEGKISEYGLGQIQDSEVQGPLTWGAHQDPAIELLLTEFRKAREEVKFELTEQLALLESISSNKGMDIEWAKSRFGKDHFDAKMKEVINEMTHERLRNSGRWPNYDKIVGIDAAANKSAHDQIGLQFMDPNSKVLLDHPDSSTILDDMGDGQGGFLFMPSPAATTLSVAQRQQMASQRLKDLHAMWAPHLLNQKASSKVIIENGLDFHGLKGWELVPTPVAPGATKKPLPNSRLRLILDEIRSQYESDSNVLSELFTGKTPKRQDSFAKEVMQQWDMAVRDLKDKRLAADRVKSDIEDAANAHIRGALQDATARDVWEQLVKDGIDTVYSRLDGSARKGVKGAGMSIGEEMPARIHEDLGPLIAELQSSNTVDLWQRNDPVFMKALISELSGVPTKDPKIKQIADVIRMTDEIQAGRLNAKGANIRYLKDRAFGAVHNPQAILDDKAVFVSQVGAQLDEVRMLQLHGPNTPNGTFDGKLHLKQMIHELELEAANPTPFDANTQGGNVANKLGRRKMMFFRDPTYAFDYDMKFGSGNTAGLIFQQVVKRAEQATIMDHFGPKYKENWSYVMQLLGKTPEIPSTYPEGLATVLLKKIDQVTSKAGRIDGTFQMLVGDLNHPQDFRMAQWGQAVRNSVNSVAIWMSGISSMTDIGNIASAARFMGVEPKDLHSDLIKRIVAMHSTSPEHQAFLQGQGAGMEAIVNAFTRMNESTNAFHQLAQKGSDLAFWGSGQEMSVRLYQMAFHDIATQHLGEQAGKAITPEFSRWLEHYGITASDWKEMSKHAAKIDGIEGVRLAPDMIPDENLSRTLRTALLDTTHQAVLEPSVSTRAATAFYTKAGTKAGEAIRTINQYKGYPLAMVSRVHRRFANAYGDAKGSMLGVTMNVGTLEKLAWASSMLSLSMTVLAIKDVLRFREPLNPLDTEQWTIGNVARVVGQAGVGPFAVFEQFMSPRQLAGPAFGMAGGLGYDVATGNGYGVTNDLMGMLPFGLTAAPIREASKAILGTIFADSYGVNYQMYLRRLQEESGQTSLFLANKR